MSNWTSPRDALPVYCHRCDRCYNPAAGRCDHGRTAMYPTPGTAPTVESESASYLLLNPFGIPVRSFGTPQQLEDYITERFGGTDAQSMNGHTGIRKATA